MESLKEKIIADIRKTGFIKELEVGSILRKNGWSTNHSDHYEDKDLSKSREIDIIATKVKNDSENHLHLEFSLVIDVKKMNKKPWVIFSVDKDTSLTQGWRIQHSGYNYMRKYGDKKQYRAGIFSTEVDYKNFKKNVSKYGIAFHEAFKSPSETSKIYESLISVCKATWHMNNRYDFGKLDDFDPEESTELYIYIPLVVLDGYLYEAILNNNGEIELNEKELIQIKLNYSSPNYGKSDIDFFPDIVHVNNLEEYLKRTDEWIEGMFEKFSLSIRKYRK
ncbi:hypothetical protein [Flagellimonas nanhaiensis]|uniref:Uncharacterized protein n=1 Tax=Flagellimonas nanhaiensis TaxID=2292706 RepID=A0A371JRM5_9FLAO|nr:hypothetical protein [Allomuricauda nanhaiensis]RDY60144.1 hypothetical protein DX873_12495 [Allomuricauda nanhaiensis]